MRCALWLCCLLFSGPAYAQSSASDGRNNIPTVDMQAITVSAGDVKPGLWKVSKGDHVLWILGTVSPLPKRIEWETRETEQAISDSQEVLELPGVEVTPKIGVLRGLFLASSLLKARRNTDDALLRDRVPPEQYRRWTTLKARYLGNDAGVERYRPIFAAGELYKKAVEDSGLTYDSPVPTQVARIARRRGVPVTPTKLQVEVRDQRGALREFSRVALDDGECFARTLDRIEVELGEMHARADAWAMGDLDALRRLPPVSAQYEACANALTGASTAQRLGLGDVPARIRANWVRQAERALTGNRVTFALLPMSELLKADGALASLRGRGYAVIEPDATTQVAVQTRR